MSMLTPNTSSRIHPRRGLRRIVYGKSQGTSPDGTAKPKKVPVLLILLVVFGSLLVWQGSRPLHRSSVMYYSSSSPGSDFDLMHAISSSSSSSSQTGKNNNNNNKEGIVDILGVPSGEAVALPNARRVGLAIDQKRHKEGYGGKGDSPHLGGFWNDLDLTTMSPYLWMHMVKNYNIKSVVDLGCGLGHAAAWFDTHQVKTKCVDGSADALNRSVVALEKQADVLVEHDFALGPW
eukprot:scaffold6506_cov171-Amphora_coffeaeformis.AAC.10